MLIQCFFAVEPMAVHPNPNNIYCISPRFEHVNSPFLLPRVATLQTQKGKQKSLRNRPRQSKTYALGRKTKTHSLESVKSGLDRVQGVECPHLMLFQILYTWARFSHQCPGGHHFEGTRGFVMKRRTCRARLWRVVAVSHKCEPGALAGSILSDFDNMFLSC